MTRCLTILTTVALTLVASAPVVAQPGWDQARFEALTAECEAFMARVDETLAAGDATMAVVFLDLGWESCNQVREQSRRRLEAIEGVEAAELVDATVERELRLAGLFAAAGSCARGAHVLGEALRLDELSSADPTEIVATASFDVLSCLPRGGLPEGRFVSVGSAQRDAWLLGELFGFVFESDGFESCPGRFPYPPSYRVDVAEAGHLRAELQADGAWRMAVTQAETVGCATGGGGLWDTEIDVAAGAVDVYIGYIGARPPSDRAFGLALGFYPVGGEATGPSHGLARLSTESPRASLRGHTLGRDEAAARFGEGCTGLVPTSPNHRLQLDVDGSIEVRLQSPMSEELTLSLVPTSTVPTSIVPTSTGTISPEATESVCAGPSSSGETTLSAELSAGEYDVFVGEPSPWGTGYEVRFSLTGATSWPPRLATIALPNDGADHVFGGVTPGPLGTLEREDCPGRYRPAPDVVLDVVEPGDWGVMVQSDDDTALVVVGPDAVLCSSDFAGNNPGLFGPLEVGSYLVFVGIEAGTGGSPFELRVTRN